MKKRSPEKNRRFIIAFACTKEEYEVIREMSRKTTCRTLSEYARKMLMEKPVAMIYRNASLDAMIDMINCVRAQLEKLTHHTALSTADKDQLKGSFQELQLIFNSIANLCTAN